MLDEPIICPSHVDTFLATTPVKPILPEKPRITVAERKKIEQELLDVLFSEEDLPNDFWDNEPEKKGFQKEYKL